MLRPAARIAIVSPSHSFTPARLLAGVERLKEWGYQPEILPVTQGVMEGKSFRYFAADDEARVQELVQAFSGDYDAVWMSRGGSGMARLLPSLPWEKLKKVPFLGFSDATTLLNALAERGFPAIHGPVLQSIADTLNETSRQALRLFLQGQPQSIAGEMWNPGEAQGSLVGGNLCVLASLCGTPAALQASNKILLLEEIQETPYKVDRLLTQLRLSGTLAGVRGVVLGQFVGCHPPAETPWSLKDILMEHLGTQIPILANVPIGHGADNHPVQLGPVRIQKNRLWPEHHDAIGTAGV